MFATWHTAWPVIVIFNTIASDIIGPGLLNHAQVTHHAFIICCTHVIAKILLQSKTIVGYNQLTIYMYTSAKFSLILIDLSTIFFRPEHSCVIGKTIDLKRYVDLATKFYQNQYLLYDASNMRAHATTHVIEHYESMIFTLGDAGYF